MIINSINNSFIHDRSAVEGAEYRHPDAANFNAWRRHLRLAEGDATESMQHAWEDVKGVKSGEFRL